MNDLPELLQDLNSQRFCKNNSCGKRFFLKFKTDPSKFCSQECHVDHLKFRRLRRENKIPKKKRKIKNNKDSIA